MFVGALLETTVLPVPFELLLAPVMLRHRPMVWWIVLAALAGCMTGAFAGYAVGAFAFQTFGQTVLQSLGAAEAMESFTERLEEGAFWAIFLVGFTPVPVQVATLGAGFTEVSLVAFTLAMLLSRGLRFGGLGLLVYRFGEDTLRLPGRHRRKALLAAALLLAAVAAILIAP